MTSLKNRLATVSAAETKYTELDDLQVSKGRKIENWTEGMELKIKVLNVNQVESAYAVKYGEYMLECLSSGESSVINAELANVMLTLAVSMKSPDDIGQFLLSKPVRSESVMLPFVVKEVSGLKMVEDTMDEDEAALTKKLAQIRKKKASQLVEEKVEAQAGSSKEENAYNNDTLAAFYSYLAGFLIRLQCRQVDNVHGNIPKSAERFKGWYEEGSDLFDDLDIGRDALEKLKAVFARKPDVTGTWVMWLAHAENEMSLTRQPLGLLQYIGVQIYAYQGLHVMTQILTIKEISKAQLGFILRQLDCPLTREGVREVYNIILNLEVTTTNPNRKTYFRYARVWGEGYFLKIRSATCAPLLYTAARVVKEITTNATSDPTQIYAIQKLGPSMKAKLEIAAMKLVGMLLEQNTYDEESGEIWDPTE
ncbi:TPA_asm: N [Mentha alphacytorhabdovirus 1]|nr:TPA_asm: N [Mentha alphacytorhabdovirus 1]